MQARRLKIERVDGLHPATPEKLKDFDVLISNSSVEVGIDFNVDRLVFSGYSKSKLLQRIGRLRNKPEDEICEAVCFVPNVLYDHLKGLSAKAGNTNVNTKGACGAVGEGDGIRARSHLLTPGDIRQWKPTFI